MALPPQRPPRRIQKSTPVFKDPYLPTRGTRDSVCRMCGSTYHHKRWYPEGKAPLTKAQTAKMSLTICPACRKIQDQFSGGVVMLNGKFPKGLKEEIIHLVRNEEARARGINPLERVISIKNRKGSVEIQTTNEKLAQRIGREIQRAYKGDTKYHWSKDDKFVRVDWHSKSSTVERGMKHGR